MQTRKLVAVILIICSSSLYASEDIYSKEYLMELGQVNKEYIDKENSNASWNKQLRDTAERIGFENGFQHQLEVEQEKILRQETYWDDFLDFADVVQFNSSGVAAGHYLIGGIVDKIDASTESINNKLIITTDGSYHLRQQPYVAPTAPYWKDYLFIHQPTEIRLPPNSARYRNAKEKKIWQEGIKDGWETGVNQAIDEMHTRWQKLFADLIGMTRYWNLVEENKIHDVRISLVRRSLTRTESSEGIQLDLNKRYIKIDNDADFNIDLRDWHFIELGADGGGSQRERLRDDVVEGNANLEDVTNAQQIIVHPTFREKNKVLSDAY